MGSILIPSQRSIKPGHPPHPAPKRPLAQPWSLLRFCQNLGNLELGYLIPVLTVISFDDVPQNRSPAIHGSAMFANCMGRRSEPLPRLSREATTSGLNLGPKFL